MLLGVAYVPTRRLWLAIEDPFRLWIVACRCEAIERVATSQYDSQLSANKTPDLCPSTSPDHDDAAHTAQPAELNRHCGNAAVRFDGFHLFGPRDVIEVGVVVRTSDPSAVEKDQRSRVPPEA